jgi:hypothetical protein
VTHADQQQHQHGLQHQGHGNMFQSAWDRQGIFHAAQRMYCLLGGRDSVQSTCQLTCAVLQDRKGAGGALVLSQLLVLPANIMLTSSFSS